MYTWLIINWISDPTFIFFDKLWASLITFWIASSISSWKTESIKSNLKMFKFGIIYVWFVIILIPLKLIPYPHLCGSLTKFSYSRRALQIIIFEFFTFKIKPRCHFIFFGFGTHSILIRAKFRYCFTHDWI
jgi:hypothetical protein